MIRTLLTSALALALLHACARHNDGMSETWKGVACVQQGRC
jgi:hypothetical protein